MGDGLTGLVSSLELLLDVNDVLEVDFLELTSYTKSVEIKTSSSSVFKFLCLSDCRPSNNGLNCTVCVCVCVSVCCCINIHI